VRREIYADGQSTLYREQTISGDDRPSPGADTPVDFEALVSNFIQTVVSDTEHPRAALISDAGVGRSDGESRERLGSPGVVVVTNARLIFVTPDQHLDLREWSVYYDDIAEVDIVREAGNRLELQTRDGVEWRCTLPDANPEILDAVTRHLRWVSRVRQAVLALEERVETAGEEVRRHAEDMHWDAAREAYQAVRTDLDTLISMVQLTTPMADETLAPELTDIERTLEEAHVRLYLERADSQLELGRYLVEQGDYDRAADVLERAHQLHRQAEGQSDAVRRADEFAFGRQRELNKALDRLEWELTAVSAEPLRQAKQAAVKARETDGLEAAVEHWETSARRYNRILALDWWRDAQEAAEDIDDARAERDRAVRQLVETYAEMANERWREGVHSHEQDDTDSALEQFASVLSTLERARTLVVEVGDTRAEALGTRLSELRTTVTDIKADAGEPSLPDEAVPAEQLTITDTAADATGDTEAPKAADPSGQTADTAGSAGGSNGQGTETASVGAGDGAADSGTSIRVERGLFTAGESEPEPEEWLPPSMSDIVAVADDREPEADLDSIRLPEGVPTPGVDGGSGTGTNGLDS